MELEFTKSKLSHFFYGVEQLRLEDAPDCTRCDFGKWLYARGLQDLAIFPEVGAMEALHKDVHDTIKELVAMPKEKTKDSGCWPASGTNAIAWWRCLKTWRCRSSGKPPERARCCFFMR